MDSEGNKIVEEQQLGLLLYRGDTVCGYLNYYVANAICKEMNFTGAERWTTKESFDIQSNYDTHISLSGGCSSADWVNCTYSDYTSNCDHSHDIFLSCTGIFSICIFAAQKCRWFNVQINENYQL